LFMTAAIVTDSTASLPSPLVEGLPLVVVPMEVHHAGKVYHDGVDITPSEFYALQRSGKVLPTTSSPQPGAFAEAFARAAEQAEEIVCVTLSSDLSSTYASAIMARETAALP